MAADLSTLTGFAFRYKATTGYTGSGDDVVAWGTSWTDDAGANSLSAISGSDKIPPSSARSGLSMVTTTRTSNSSQLNNIFKSSGTSLNCAGMGVVMIGRMAGGTYGAKRNICCVGTAGAGGEFQPGVSAAGLLTVANSADVTVRTSSLRMPTGLTCAAWQVSTASGGSCYMKVLGLDAYTGSGIASTANNGWLRLFHAENGTGKWPGAVRELAFFNTATAVSSQIAEIEAYANENVGVTIPTEGHVICLGDSYGEGAFTWFCDHTWPGIVAEALPDWFVVNNCRSGYDLSEIYTDRATLIDATSDRPLGTSVPLMFFIDAGRNDWISGASLATMQTRAETLASYLRTTYPTCGIVFCTQVPTGVISGSGIEGNWTIGSGFNEWLLSGGLSAYGVRVCDLAAIDSYEPGIAPDEADITAVVLGTNYDIYNTTPAATNDATHIGPTGLDAMASTYTSTAQAAADALAGGPSRKAFAIGII